MEKTAFNMSCLPLTPTEGIATNSRTRLFYQVTPSGLTDYKSVMKLVPVQMHPGKTISKIQPLATSLVHMVTPQLPNIIQGTGSLTPVRLCVTPNVEIKLPLTDLPCSAQTKTFITTSPKPGTTAVISGVSFIQTKPCPSATPASLISKVGPKAQQTNAKVLPNKPSSHSNVFCASPVTHVNQTVSPAASQVTVKIQVAPPSSATASFFANSSQSTVICVSPPKPSATLCTQWNKIRTFSNVTTNKSVRDSHKSQTLIPHYSPRSSSPIKWVVEEGGLLPTSPSPSSSPPSLISPTVASHVLEVVTKREQSNNNSKTTRPQVMIGETKNMENKSEFTVVMCNNTVFFRVKKNQGSKDESQERRGQSEVINLCDEHLDSKEEACLNEDHVEFMAYIPGQTISSSGEKTTEKASQTRNSPEVDRGDQYNSANLAFSHRKRKSHSTEISACVSAAPCPVADGKLKRTFGITSELKINLRRIQVNSSDTDRSYLTQVPPLDYTEPIDEDFLCSQTCPTVSASSSRVSRTRKRTKCPCCSPAALHRHHARSRRSKPAGGERRDTSRKLFKLQPTLVPAVENGSPGQDVDSEEFQIHQQIQLLREALRLKEAALQKLKNNTHF